MERGSAKVLTSKEAKKLVESLSEKSLSSEEEMQRFQQLRALLQQDERNIDALSKSGLLSVLVEKFKSINDQKQVLLLQVLAALGHLVQKSLQRARVVIELGLLQAVLKTLGKKQTTEGVLLLGVQVISFMVEGNSESLRDLHRADGLKTLRTILNRGCVRTSILNARVVNLLSQLLQSFPTEEESFACAITQDFSVAVRKLDHNGSSPKDEGVCITLAQGLGFMLDSFPACADYVFREGFVKVATRLLSMGPKISTHLAETMCWTCTYLIGGSPEKASKLVRETQGVDPFAMIVKRGAQIEDALAQAASSLLSNLVDALLKSNDAKCVEMAADLLRQLADHARSIFRLRNANQKLFRTGKERSGFELTGAIFTTCNSMRVLRKISKIGGSPLETLLSQNILTVFLELLEASKQFPQRLRAEILKELGLLVESAPKIGHHLAKQGACSSLANIFSICTSTLELCNATRALACLVEHDSEIGMEIADIAISADCVEELIDILSKRETRKDVIDGEVLLNSVGALGYIIRRQAKVADAASPCGNPLQSKSEETNLKSCAVLTTILASNPSEDSLLWNSLWALIYLMDGLDGEKCKETIRKNGGLQVLQSLVENKTNNQPLVCSAATAMFHLLESCNAEEISMVPLPIRQKILVCATRSRPAACSNGINDTEFGTIDVPIDPANIAQSTVCTLDKLDGQTLRSNGLKIKYITGHLQHVGIDAGGVRRDWLSRLSNEIFDPKFNLVISGFFPNDSVQISPKPDFGGMSEADQQEWYRLMGRVIGLSVLYGDPLGVALVPSVCKSILEKTPVFEDIKNISKQCFTTMQKLRELRENDEEQFKIALQDLTFTVNSRECMMKEAFERSSSNQATPTLSLIVSVPSSTPKMSPSPFSSRSRPETWAEFTSAMNEARHSQDRDRIRELLHVQNEFKSMKRPRDRQNEELISEPSAKRMRRMMSDLMDGGRTEVLGAHNFDRYLEKLTHKLLLENVSTQIAFIKEGFHEVLPREIVLKLITPDELSRLVEGDRNVNLEHWKKNTIYKGIARDAKQKRWFWEYVASLDKKGRQDLLLWATGWRAIGQDGFANKKFTIEMTKVTSDEENERLPSVATCGFHLWLPKYRSKEQLKRKFELALRETTFGNC